MFKERLLESLKLSQNTSELDEESLRVITKIQNSKRLSSKEFLKVYDAIRREGPNTIYQNPNNWRRSEDTL